MQIIDLIKTGANVQVTISAEELRTFLAEVSEQVYAAKEQAAQASNNNVVMTSKEVCDYLGVSRATLCRWQNEGYLTPKSRIGARPMFSTEEVERIKKGA